MRRWFAILLLALLPLQFSWAAVAAYCGHESGAAQSQHLGHHAHEHPADPSGEPPSTEKLPGVPDPDCHHCHSQIAALPQGVLPPNITMRPARFARADARCAAALAPDRPERPQWARFA